MPTYTVAFCGTACSRDEGEVDRSRPFKAFNPVSLFKDSHSVSDKPIFDKDTGYIPVRLHMDISGRLKATNPSVTVRGIGENDWADQLDSSDVIGKGPLAVPPGLRSAIESYSGGGNQYSLKAQADGKGVAALAWHAANLAVAAIKNGADVINFVGHSRGAVVSIMAAWFVYAYGGPLYKHTPINIFAIDPVPGYGEWYGIITQLSPNVRNYVGVYAWDHMDMGFTPVVPRPNAQMTDFAGHYKAEAQILGNSWDSLADKSQLDDPLIPNKNGLGQPQGYQLYACRGRHGTVAGISTSDGAYDASNVSAEAAAVPRLVYKLARAYLTQWGTVFQTRCRVREDAKTLRRKIHSARSEFNVMGGGETRTSRVWGRLSVRRVSSIHGSSGLDKYYLEDVVGDPPYRLFYPCTIERTGGGWVKWKFL